MLTDHAQISKLNKKFDHGTACKLRRASRHRQTLIRLGCTTGADLLESRGWSTPGCPSASNMRLFVVLGSSCLAVAAVSANSMAAASPNNRMWTATPWPTGSPVRMNGMPKWLSQPGKRGVSSIELSTRCTDLQLILQGCRARTSYGSDRNTVW